LAILGPVVGAPFDSDAEVIEVCRREMQGIIDRTDWSKTGKELQDSPGLPHQWVQLIALDLTEVGRFEIDLPRVATAGYPKVLADALRRHWVYRHKDGRVVTLQLSQRIKLRTLGYVRAKGFVNAIHERS
jgi:hypothetical protein